MKGQFMRDGVSVRVGHLLSAFCMRNNAMPKPFSCVFHLFIWTISGRLLFIINDFIRCETIFGGARTWLLSSGCGCGARCNGEPKQTIKMRMSENWLIGY